MSDTACAVCGAQTRNETWEGVPIHCIECGASPDETATSAGQYRWHRPGRWGSVVTHFPSYSAAIRHVQQLSLERRGDLFELWFVADDGEYLLATVTDAEVSRV